MYEVSYYTMSAAMYAASALSDEGCLMEVAVLAAKYQGTLDQQDPTHRLASRHGRTGLFKALSHLALIRLQRLQLQHYRPP
jgi:hypothetical protein